MTILFLVVAAFVVIVGMTKVRVPPRKPWRVLVPLFFWATLVAIGVGFWAAATGPR